MSDSDFLDEELVPMPGRSPYSSYNEYLSQRIPRVTDEPNVTVEMHGRNDVPYVELWGWTHAITVDFPGIKKNLVMKTMKIPDDGTLPEELESLKFLARSLEDYSRIGSFRYEMLMSPIFVQVIAKKKVDLVSMKNKDELCKILILGTLIVADSTGACILTLVNESVGIVHEKVEVGDYLIISKGSFQEPPPHRVTGIASPYAGKKLLNLEIKVDKYQVRHICHVPFHTHSRLKLLPINTFTVGEKLWIPSEILNDPKFNLFKQTTIFSRSHDTINPRQKRPIMYFDLMGYISYVGMIQRMSTYTSNFALFKAETSEEGELPNYVKTSQILRPLRQFMAFRWIQLIDKNSQKPVLLQMFMKKDMLPVQRQLVPGTFVVLSRCQVSPEDFMDLYLTTSIYTKLYLPDENLPLYFKLVPQNFFRSVTCHISAKSCEKLLKRDDIVWSAGGCLTPKIKSAEGFLEFHKSRIKYTFDKKIIKSFPDNHKFERRESLITTFRGTIVGVQKITMEIAPNGEMYEKLHPFSFGSEESLCVNQENWQTLTSCFTTDKESDNWFCHRRILPRFTIKTPDLTRTRTMMKEVVAFYDKYCSPLLLPCVYPSMPKSQPTPLSKCTKLDGLPFYRIIIRDADSEKWYDTLWRGMPVETMEEKWKAAVGKVIVGLIDIHQYEITGGLDVALRDFVVDEEIAGTPDNVYANLNGTVV